MKGYFSYYRTRPWIPNYSYLYTLKAKKYGTYRDLFHYSKHHNRQKGNQRVRFKTYLKLRQINEARRKVLKMLYA
jgi:hypothetical protein